LRGIVFVVIRALALKTTFECADTLAQSMTQFREAFVAEKQDYESKNEKMA
jgi:hypothetical protein